MQLANQKRQDNINYCPGQRKMSPIGLAAKSAHIIVMRVPLISLAYMAEGFKILFLERAHKPVCH